MSEVDPSRDERWETFVESHPFGWICHTAAWKEILETSFKHVRARYLALTREKTGEIKAALAICHVRSWMTGNRLVSLPFATLCDPLVSSADEFKILLDAAIALREQLGSKYLEIRALHSRELLTDGRMSLHRNYKHHYLTLDREPRQLMKRFHRTCVRQRIRRAQNSQLKVEEGKNETDLREFYCLYLKTRQRLLLPPQPYRFIRTLWQKLHHRDSVTLLLARHNGQSIGGMMLLMFKDRVSAEYAVVDEDFLHLSPNHLLFWTAIKKAQTEGFGVFDFGRTATDNRGLMDFKRRWGTQVVDLIQAFSPVNAAQQLPGYAGLSQKVLATLCTRTPVSAYRALGNFCYRHLG